MIEETRGLKGRLEYSANLFDAATVGRMLGHLRTVLKSVLVDPDQRLGGLPLLTSSERRQVLIEWNSTHVDYPQDRCIHELFEEQAERTPDAVAVDFETNERLTYRELNRRANQLARHLQKLGVGPEVLVGIYVERSVEMVVGLLGILKAGGAYVPLDPLYTKERLSVVIEDTQAPVLLTQQTFAEGLSKHGVRVVRLDADWRTIAREDEKNLDNVVTTDVAAYVIYTSGSTGRPKGVVVEHRARSGYVVAAVAAYEISASDRVLQFASLSFDASVEEIFPCLTRGGTLVLRSGQIIDSMERFVRECQEREISVLSLPTAFWHELALAFEREKLILPPSVRLVIIGGEKALASRVAQWHAYMTQTARSARLINTYGPTEATVVATLCELRPEASCVSSTQAEVPIGRPLGNAQTYILDRHLNPVPIGVSGELYIGGPILARGYLNRSALTEEKFIPHPYNDELGARLYKTGDRVRYWANGDIEFLGRLDSQVKLRGFRIELGEVESILNGHSAVRESVVLLREDTPEQKRLVAYVVPAGKELSHGELRAFLGERLPEHMVPSAFVVLEALPLTLNGKIDRHALPEPAATRPDPEGGFAAPCDALEKRLAGLWEKTLSIQAVGIDDDFFELGGHSLLAVRLFRRIEETFGQRLPLATLFQAPTVRQLADILRRWESKEAPRSSLMAIQPHGSRPPFFCVHGGGGEALCFYALAQHLGPDQPFYAYQTRGQHEEQPVFLKIEDMAASYIRKLQELQPEGPYYLGGFPLAVL